MLNFTTVYHDQIEKWIQSKPHKNVPRLDGIVIGNVSYDDANRLNNEWSVNDYLNTFVPTCKYDDGSGPFGRCNHTGLEVYKGKFKILIIGNSFAANHGRLIHQECGSKARELVQISISACEPLYPAVKYGQRCVDTVEMFKKVVADEKPDYAFLTSRFLDIGDPFAAGVTRVEDDPIYKSMKKSFDVLVTSVKFKVFVFMQIPEIVPSNIEKIVEVIKNKEDLAEFDKSFVQRNHTIARVRYEKMVQGCEKCVPFDYDSLFWNRTTSTWRFYDEANNGLSYMTTINHLSFHGLELVRHIFSNLCNLIIPDPRGGSKLKLEVSHAFITSAYYYPTSKSLGSNAVAFNMAIDQRSHSMQNHTFTVIGTNLTTSLSTVATSQAEGVGNCRYTTLMGRTNTVENLKTLEIESNEMTVQIPFKMARYTAPKPVIICISPQFVAEQWQIFLMHVHAANRFGGHLHIYLTSIIKSYFELMQEYERQGYLTLDYWLRMKFSNIESQYFDPNANIEWRNQAGAQTDCLLQYKEAAEYIAFFDMDDILFPKNYPTYLEEFNAVLATNPGTNYMFYGRREHEFVKAPTLSEFSFTELVDSLRSSKVVKRGKVVVRTDAYNATWIHYSKHVSFMTRANVTSPTLVHVQLPVEKDGKRKNTSRNMWKIEFGPLNETIREDDIRAIEEDIYRIKNASTIQSLAPQLPNADFYLPIVFKCYYDAFYGAAFDHKPGGFGCPNADFCELPQRENYKCIHSDAQYYSGPSMKPVTYHFTSHSFWSKDIGCYQ
ncbi:hypothetical protein L3Y34_003970 [Caenorhabditis briggsae]|uniref:SGNH domain-containing protein n=1 Tax=Caenorhabditis briggsae TaxID=6238 RepID=A0AAE9ACP2_CAEBR|nr:hypothetical protein L3Y34_003970 [Caenorhabditis briggsae]